MEYWLAVEGESDGVQLSYLRAITHYWCNRHCKGLSNNSDQLRRICHRDPEDWPFIFPVVFDNDRFFTLGADGLWHQKRAAAEWEIAAARYAKAVNAGSKRWRGKNKNERSEVMKRVRKGERNAK